MIILVFVLVQNYLWAHLLDYPNEHLPYNVTRRTLKGLLSGIPPYNWHASISSISYCVSHILPIYCLPSINSLQVRLHCILSSRELATCTPNLLPQESTPTVIHTKHTPTLFKCLQCILSQVYHQHMLLHSIKWIKKNETTCN